MERKKKRRSEDDKRWHYDNIESHIYYPGLANAWLCCNAMHECMNVWMSECVCVRCVQQRNQHQRAEQHHQYQLVRFCHQTRRSSGQPDIVLHCMSYSASEIFIASLSLLVFLFFDFCFSYSEAIFSDFLSPFLNHILPRFFFMLHRRARKRTVNWNEIDSWTCVCLIVQHLYKDDASSLSLSASLSLFVWWCGRPEPMAYGFIALRFVVYVPAKAYGHLNVW